MDAQVILHRRQMADVIESEDLTRLAKLTSEIGDVVDRQIERDNEENRDHDLLLALLRQVTALADQLQLRETARTTAA
jgi:hypothetical protein